MRYDSNIKKIHIVFLLTKFNDIVYYDNDFENDIYLFFYLKTSKKFSIYKLNKINTEYRKQR